MSNLIFSPLYEDNDILVIEKRKAFLSQRGDEGSQESLGEFIARTKGVEIYPVHRLDREVLGIMIFGKTAEAAKSLSLAFKERKVQKTYWAWVQGKVSKESDTLVHYLKKNNKTNLTTVFPRPTPEAKRAELDYKRLKQDSGRSLLEVELKTGRSHQIRAQLSKIGHPIIGDQRYGKRLSESRRGDYMDTDIQLRSVRLALAHPVSGEWMEWRLKLSMDNLFPSK